MGSAGIICIALVIVGVAVAALAGVTCVITSGLRCPHHHCTMRMIGSELRIVCNICGRDVYPPLVRQSGERGAGAWR